MTPIQRRREGFTGQHLVVLPQAVIARMQSHPLLRGCFPSATGYFPKAPGHLVERENGVPEMILITCLSGRGWVRLAYGEVIHVDADSALLIPPGTPHAYGADDALPWSIMWAHCRGDDLPQFQELLGVSSASPLLHLPARAFELMEFAAIYKHLENGHTLANLFSSAAKLRFVFAEMNRLHLPAHPRARSAEEALQHSIAWMQRNLHRRPTLEELAREAGLSISYYSAVFTRRTGFAPIHYFLRLKIQRACQLLDTTSMRVKEVANELGCEDAFYFSRLFKSIMGHSPRVYRNIPKG